MVLGCTIVIKKTPLPQRTSSSIKFLDFKAFKKHFVLTYEKAKQDGSDSYHPKTIKKSLNLLVFTCKSLKCST